MGVRGSRRARMAVMDAVVGDRQRPATGGGRQQAVAGNRLWSDLALWSVLATRRRKRSAGPDAPQPVAERPPARPPRAKKIAPPGFTRQARGPALGSHDHRAHDGSLWTTGQPPDDSGTRSVLRRIGRRRACERAGWGQSAEVRGERAVGDVPALVVLGVAVLGVALFADAGFAAVLAAAVLTDADLADAGFAAVLAAAVLTDADLADAGFAAVLAAAVLTDADLADAGFAAVLAAAVLAAADLAVAVLAVAVLAVAVLAVAVLAVAAVEAATRCSSKMTPPLRPRLAGAAGPVLTRGPRISCRKPPVWLPSAAATSSGVPVRDDPPAAGAALRAHVDDPVGSLDHVEVVLDDDHGVAGVDEPPGEPPAACGCPRSAVRWSARRARRSCDPWSGAAARPRA